MHKFATICFAGLGMLLLASGCGENGLIRARGRVVKGDEAFIPEEGQSLRIQFVPITDDGKPPLSKYYAEFDEETGTFVAVGPQREGVPPGKYIVTVELIKKKMDLWEGCFDGDNSPFTVEVDDESEEIVLDLDTPSKTVPVKQQTNAGD